MASPSESAAHAAAPPAADHDRDRDHDHDQAVASSPDGSVDSGDVQPLPGRGRPVTKLQRPGLGSRKSSGTIIIPRDSPSVETREQYAADDARGMSPRRSGDDIAKLGNDARQALEEQAKVLQDNLLEIIDRVDSVKSEHEKLEGGNKFLQSYIGELMQTSKITSSMPNRRKDRRRVPERTASARASQGTA